MPSTMKTHCYQLLLLLWKSFLLRKRHYIVTTIEVLLPLLLSLIPLAIVYSVGGSMSNDKGSLPNTRNATIFSPYDPLTAKLPNPVILYAPNSSEATLLMERAIKKTNLDRPQLIPMNTEADIERYVANMILNHLFYGTILGVVFINLNNKAQPPDLHYKLRFSSQYGADNFNTKNLYSSIDFGTPRMDDVYNRTGFWTYQLAIDQTFIEMVQDEGSVSKKDIQVMMQRFPYPPYNEGNTFNITSLDLIPIIIIYGLVILCPVIVKRTIDEKVNGAKEMMKMMGMKDWVYWSSNFINNFLVLFVICLLLMFFYGVHFKPNLSVIYYTNILIFFIIMVLYSAALVMFCLALTTFFNRPIVGVIFIIIISALSHGLLSSFYFSLFNSSNLGFLSLGSKLGICLLPNGALLMACKIMSVLESYRIGSQWNNIATFYYFDVNLLMVMAMMVVSCLIYTVILWYVDAVWPWQYGIPKPFYFPFTKSYWLGTKSDTSEREESCYSEQSKFFEDDPVGKTPGVIISNLTKVYKTGTHSKVAVNNLSLKIFTGQITALLGHNGAGKTTTMNILTGLYPPTSGTASINGYDILTDTKSARQSLGLCPQHNVLYDSLTVEEHLKLFAGLKGVPWSQLSQEVADTLKVINMEMRKTELSKNLSGGMKRKLSLGMAVIGNSEVLILDEPTSGMDPQARRNVWDMLQNLRHNRTILLTTHYMEEADILGDRIAIMAEGNLKCLGTPIFLKRNFGAGYYVRIIKNNKCPSQPITEVLKKHIAEAQLESSASGELSYSLTSATSSNFSALFKELEERKEELGIVSCGVSVTTMEDVFLNVGQDVDSSVEKNTSDAISMECLEFLQEESVSLLVNSTLKGFSKLLQQIKGLLLKRFHYLRRHWVLLIFQIAIPFLVFTLMIYLTGHTMDMGNGESPPLNLDLHSLFGDSKGFYKFAGSDAETFTLSYFNSVLQNSGVSSSNQNNPTDYIINIGKKDMANYLQKYFVGGEANGTSDGELILKAWFNGEPFHVGAMSVNLMDTAILQYVTNSTASIKIINAPLIINTDMFNVNNMLPLVFMMCAIFVPLSLSFLSSSFALFPIHERVSKAKLLQLMTGVNPLTFWLTTFLVDFLEHFACCLIMLIPFALVDSQHAFAGHPDAMGAVLLLLMMYGWCAIPLTYVISFIPKKPSTGFVLVVIINVITGILATSVMASLESVYMSNSKFQTALWVLRLLPMFAVSWGFGNVYATATNNVKCNKLSPEMQDYICPTLYEQNKTMFECCKDMCQQYDRCFKETYPIAWKSNSCGYDLFFMAIGGFIFFVLLFLLEKNFYNIFSKIKKMILQRKGETSVPVCSPFTFQTQEDEDVKDEQNRVENLFHENRSNEEAMIVFHLTKVFHSITAVDSVTFSVHKKECFGLLGVNGAGKTSTFRMLTGDLLPTEGNAVIHGYSLQDNLKLFQSFIGYCPQFDALLDRLTGREMITLLARLRGMPEKNVIPAVNYLIHMVDLQNHSDKLTKDYSGGNKRKLSLALALIGSPPVIFLDEPTSGVDPVARRKIWNSLVTVRNVTGASVVLTSHSMEECEALCGRLAIMVNGQFRCLGSIQQLKSRFGRGFTVIIKLKKEFSLDTNYTQSVRNFIETSFSAATLKDIHQGIMSYHITDTTVPWSQLFGVLEQAKQSFQLEDYLISDTSLEQIFLTFARSQIISAANVS